MKIEPGTPANGFVRGGLVGCRISCKFYEPVGKERVCLKKPDGSAEVMG
jgi:hypothetical protein